MPARTCEVCGERAAVYLCQNCGTAVCPACRVGWFCRKCSNGEANRIKRAWKPIRIGPIPLLVIAVGVMVAGFSLVFIGSNMGPESGGCFIWPFPFVIGCGLGAGAAAPTISLLFLIVFAFVSVFWGFSRRWAGPDQS